MKNRKLLLIVSLVLALTMSLGGTLAYLTDTDEAVNVMTLGNVKIEQHEKDAAGNIFEQGQPLYPAYIEGEKITGAIDKVVTVENTGNSDAYVRTWIAFEAGKLDVSNFDKVIHTEFGGEGYTLSNPQINEIEGVKYYVVCATYNDALVAGATTQPSLKQVYMDKDAGNAEVAQFGETYEILVYTQAVQTKNMEHLTPAQALSAGFGDEHPWVDGVNELPTVVVKTAADLKTALEEGGTTVVLGADIDMGTEMVTIPAGVNARLDLAGHDITADHSSKSGESTSLFNVKKGASLTINGDGNVHFAVPTSQKVTATINNESGNVTINGGNYTIDYGTYEQGYLIPAIVDNNTTNGAATLTINGGTFIHDRNMLRNFSNHKSEVAKIVINGGTFLADGDGESFIWNQKPSVNVPAGAGVVEINGGTFVGVKVDDEFTNNQYDPAGENVTVVPNEVTVDENGAVRIYSGYQLAQLNKALDKKSMDPKSIILMADIDMSGEAWKPVDLHADSKVKSLSLIDGNGHTISNLTINGQAMFSRFAGAAETVTVKDLAFENATVNSTAINTSILTVQSYQNVVLDNVDVKNSSITGTYKVAPLIATLYDENEAKSKSLIVKNCDVSNTMVKATQHDFCTAGMVAFVFAADGETISFENCTVKNVTLIAPNDGYKAHAFVYTTGSTNLCNEVNGVTVTNCTFKAQ